jgi:hypothetical protein
MYSFIGTPRLLVVFALLCLSSAGEERTSTTAAGLHSIKVVVSGDSQFRSGWDWWSGGLKYRRPVLAGVAAEKADVVLFTGDLVEKGSDKEDWELFDEEMQAVIESTPTFASAVGNHDLKANGEVALNHFYQRVKAARRQSYYAFRRGPVLFVVLNSNDSLAPGSTQRSWLETQLSHVPADIKYVITSMHHPMRTRSRRRIFARGHEALPEHKELATWLEMQADKSHYRILSFSGHVHNYERYSSNGVMFIVSGGSGGRPHDLEREPQDAYTGTGPTYHYCVIEADLNQLRFRMRRLDQRDLKWTDADAFNVAAKQP